MRRLQTIAKGGLFLLAFGCARSGTSGLADIPSQAAHQAVLPATPSAPIQPIAQQSVLPEPEPEASAFRPWLRTNAELTLYRIERGVAVLLVATDADSLTLTPGYVLNDQGLREEPRLLPGLEMEPPNRRSATPGVLLRGRVSLTGAWPGKAGAHVDLMPQGGCAGCFSEYEWNGSRWVDAKPAILPSWQSGWTDVPASTVHFRNGVTFWEQFDSGGSIFFLDPHGRQRALRQRTPAPRECEGPTRLDDRFSGVALDDGSLIGVGIDCRTGVASVEHWAGGATKSRVSELPGHPHGVVRMGNFEDPVRYEVRSSTDVVLAFTLDGHQDPNANVRPYVAAFDGKAWSELPFPSTGSIRDFVRAADGSIWMLTLADVFELWRYPGVGVAGAVWTQLWTGGSATLLLDRLKMPWLRTEESVIDCTQVTLVSHTMPRCEDGKAQYRVDGLDFTSAGKPVVAATCESAPTRGHVLMVEGEPAAGGTVER